MVKRYVISRNGISWSFPSFREAAALIRTDDRGEIICQIDGKEAWKMAKDGDKWTRIEDGKAKAIDSDKIATLINMVDR